MQTLSHSVQRVIYWLTCIFCCTLAEVLDVRVTSEPNGPTYQAATPVHVMCRVSGDYYTPVTFQWNSTCTGDCFILESDLPTVNRSVLHSADSGMHTCTVIDAVGNTGSASIWMNVVGKCTTPCKLFCYFICYCSLY